MSQAEFLDVNESLRVPLAELVFQFSRSSGPGGQNVNKVNSRVQMRWNLEMTQSLPEEVLSRLKSRQRRRINQAGELMLTSQRYRDQSRNIDDCLAKLRELLAEASARPTPRRPTRPTSGARRRRLAGKRERAERKQARRPPKLDD